MYLHIFIHVLSDNKRRLFIVISLTVIYFREAAAGLDHANDKEQHQQGVADGLEPAVDVHHHIPDRAALEVLGGVRDKLPDLAQFAVPDIQSVLQILNDPVIRH